MLEYLTVLFFREIIHDATTDGSMPLIYIFAGRQICVSKLISIDYNYY